MINQIELAEQFEKIFISDEVDKFYEEWKLENNKKQPTTWDKISNVLFLPFIILLFGGCILWVYHAFNRVNQSIMKFGDEVDFITDVWVNGEIVKQWSIPAENVTDSIKTAQYNEAEKLYNSLTK